MSEVTLELATNETEMQKILNDWKKKSLNAMPTQKYKIPIKNTKNQQKKHTKKQQAAGKGSSDSKPQMLPQPKIAKIKDSIFCIYLGSQLITFIFVTPEEKSMGKTKTTFRNLNPYSYTFPENIKFVFGNGSDFIYVGLENQLYILSFKWVKQNTEEGKQVNMIKQIQKVEVKQLPKLKGISFIKQLKQQIQNPQLVAITAEKIYKYNIVHNFKLAEEQRILFSNPKQKQSFNQINTLQILCEDNIYLYLFGTKQGVQQQMNEKYEGNSKMKKCQFLYLIKFNVSQKSVDSIPINISMIDHVFETGIFGKSKIFQQGPSVFLISLYQQIIVIRYHFQKYVVWDNISLASSKSNEKKGQLILADKIVMVYTQMGQIFAHNIYFCFKQSKLKYPRIDNFKGNDNDEQILYDAIILQYQPGVFMKVLFYFKQADVYSPTNKVAMHKQQKGIGDHKQYLFFNILCIQQSDPQIKLGQLFRNKKTPQQISQFVQRFNIAEITKSKCEWTVSQKTQKDIQNLLLQINDNQFIQNQLTKILKSIPHDLKFLGRIQKKQIQRYKKMLAIKLLKNDQQKDTQKIQKLIQQTGTPYSKQQIGIIKQYIKWVMESIMFDKKLVYSKNFLEFMQYDFIEIGKLKAASLKEQIKLLSCKGFQKRLQYFLNSFKYMVLANFQNIFQFLIQDKNEKQIQNFFIQSFPFILPKFEEPSEIFKKKNSALALQRISKARRTSFSPLNFQLKQIDIKPEEDNCQLWQDKFSDENEKKKIQTKQSFRQQIFKQIDEWHKNYKASQTNQKQKSRNKFYKQCLPVENAKRQFSIILDQFVNQEWFRTNKSKQHSIIQLDHTQLQKKFRYLKRIGVFHLLIKFFYYKISIKNPQQNYKQKNVDKILDQFRKKQLIPQSFQQNILVRRQVYNRIRQNGKFTVQLPILQRFLIFQETEYFDFIFKNFRQLLLRQIKAIYDKIIPGFFKQKFQIYLNSDSIVLSQIINFLDQFQGSANDDIRMDVFNCIKKLLRVNDKQNTVSFVNKLMDKQILKNQGANDALIDQAKVTFGCYFYDFFAVFQQSKTYKQLIDQTNVQQYEKCQIIKSILQKYCHNQYDGAHSQPPISSQFSQEQDYTGIIIKFQQKYGLQQVQFPLTNQPLQFFSIVLYLIDTLRFQIKTQIVFDKFIQLLLEVQKYDDLVFFIDSFRSDIGGEGLDQQQQRLNQQQFKTKNFQLLKQFYFNDNFSVKERTIQNILMWAKRQYQDTYQQMKSRLASTTTTKKKIQYQKVLNKIGFAFAQVIDKLQLSNAEIVREKSFLKLLNNLKDIDPNLAFYTLQKRFQNFNDNYLQQYSPLLNQLSSFIYMIRLLKVIPKQNFDKKTQQTDQIDRQINLMQSIYLQFQMSSKYNYKQDNKIQEQSGLIRFYMQLAMRLIQDKQFLYCKHVIVKIIQQQFYFRDVFFNFLASIAENRNNQDDRTQLSQNGIKNYVKNFIQISHQRNMINNFNSFIDENQINHFQGTKLQRTQSQSVRNQSQSIAPSMKQQSFRDRIQMQKRKSKRISIDPQGFKLIQKAFINNKQLLPLKQQKQSPNFSFQIFQALIQSNRIDEAYYFLVRNTLMSVSQGRYIDQNGQKSDSYALISIYTKCLQKYLCEQFYPTFSFYRNKHAMLINQYQRKDIIKDINIAISRLKQMVADLKLSIGDFYKVKPQQTSKNLVNQMITKQLPSTHLDINQQNRRNQQIRAAKQAELQMFQQMKQKHKQLQQKLYQLNKLYESFMESVGLDPNIKLDEEQIAKGNFKLDTMNREITPGELMNVSLNAKQNNYNNYNNQIKNSPRFETNGVGMFTAQDLSKRMFQQSQKQKQKLRSKIKQKQDPKFAQLQRQVNQQLKQTKIISDKYQNDQQNRSKPTQIKLKTAKLYNELKQKQKKQLDSIKQSYKSKTSQRVQNIIQQMRLRISKVCDKSDAKSKFSQIDIDSSQPNRSRRNSVQTQGQLNKKGVTFYKDLLPPPDLKPPRFQRQNSGTDSMATNSRNQISSSRKYQVKLHQVGGNTKNIYMPVTMNAQSKQLGSRVSSVNNQFNINHNNSKPQSFIDEIKLKTQINIKQKQKQKQQQKYKDEILDKYKSSHHMQQSSSKSRLVTSLPQLIKLFQQKQPQCKKYVQKLQFVKNNVQVGLQITKNIYSTVTNFEVFVRFLGYIIQSNPKYKQVLQQKAYKIALQAMGIQYKINLKQLFPIQIFTQIKNVPIKQYYKTAYEIMKPNLMKILTKQQINVHGIAVLYRFGFGSQNIYYYRVYEDYIKVLLKDYSENNLDQKKLFLLSEKLRTLYSNINTENRQNKFQQLMREIQNQGKRKILAKQMLKILQRRSQMLTGQKQIDLKQVLIRLV